MSIKLRRFYPIFIVVIEVCLLLSFLPSFSGTASFDLKPFLFSQVLVCLIGLSFYLKKCLPISITFALLIISNFAITPTTLSNAIKLPKNLSQKVQVEGPLLTGFSGISSITTDSHGFRTLNRVNYEKKLEKFRIFTIGGSTTEQILLDDHKTWTHLLSSKLNIQTNLKKIFILDFFIIAFRAKIRFFLEF
jgi:hypothetical protein